MRRKGMGHWLDSGVPASGPPTHLALLASRQQIESRLLATGAQFAIAQKVVLDGVCVCVLGKLVEPEAGEADYALI